MHVHWLQMFMIQTGTFYDEIINISYSMDNLQEGNIITITIRYNQWQMESIPLIGSLLYQKNKYTQNELSNNWCVIIVTDIWYYQITQTIWVDHFGKSKKDSSSCQLSEMARFDE